MDFGENLVLALISAIVGALAAFFLGFFFQMHENKKVTRKAKQILFHFFKAYQTEYETKTLPLEATYRFDLERWVALCDEYVLGCRDKILVSDYLETLHQISTEHEEEFNHENDGRRSAMMNSLIKKHKLVG